VEPDAIYAREDGYRALLEIERGGTVQNNRLRMDVVETLLTSGAHHLALIVPTTSTAAVPTTSPSTSSRRCTQARLLRLT